MPMTYQDKAHHYGLTSLVLHWVNAILILMVCLSGRQIFNPSSTLSQSESLAVHINVALFAIPLIGIRIFWRAYQGYPMPTKASRLRKGIALYHYFLFGLIIVSYISGLSLASFNLFELLNPTGDILNAKNQGLHSHQLVGIIIYFSLLLHIIGASRQILFSKGSASKRMLSLDDDG